MRPARLLALLAWALPSACAGWSLDLNPVYLGQADAQEARSLSLGPLFDDRIGPGERETALHPLWRRVATPDSTEIQVVDPLLLYRRTDELTEARFLALWWYRNYHPPHQPAEQDTMLLPFWFSGDGPPGDSYMALFPLLGTIRNFAGFEEAFFVLFPLYYQVRKNITEPEVFHNITPLVGWADGGPRDGSFRILPLYGRWLWEGKFERHSVLWPFIHYQKNDLHRERPSTLWAVWPLFKSDQGERHSRWTFLWPFFRFHTEQAPLEESDDLPGGDPDHQYHHTDILWPVYRSQHTRDFDRLRVFPFFSRYRSEELDSDSYAIPFLWRRQERQSTYVKDSFDLVPLLHWEEKTWRDGREPDEALRLWPLFAWKHGGDGSAALTVPALLPLDIGRFTADFEANWGPLFQLYHSEHLPDGGIRRSALFRLFRQESGIGGSRWSIPLLYSGQRRQGQTTHDLLWGLIRVQTGRGGLGLRLLFVPLLRPDKEQP